MLYHQDQTCLLDPVSLAVTNREAVSIRILYQQKKKETDLATCHSCNDASETNEHVFLCPAEKRQEWRTQFLIKLQKYLDTIKTENTIMIIVINGLEQYVKQQSLQPNDYSDRYTTLIQRQNTIGWFNLLKGQFTKEWSIKTNRMDDDLCLWV